MAHTRARQVLAVLAVASASCAREATSPTGPSVPLQERTADDTHLGFESSGTKPDGFETSVVSDPKRNEDGVIEATAPVTVEYDACRSRSGDGSPLRFSFDWDFDHVPDVVGTGDACLQKHTYRVDPFDEGRGDVTFRTNVCVAAADYVSCREFTIVTPRPAGCQGPNDDTFTGLAVEHETFSPVAGNVFANDCAVEPFLGAFAIELVNVMNVSFELNGDVHLICPEVGPFSARLYYLTASGRADVLLEGECT